MNSPIIRKVDETGSIYLGTDRKTAKDYFLVGFPDNQIRAWTADSFYTLVKALRSEVARGIYNPTKKLVFSAKQQTTRGSLLRIPRIIREEKGINCGDLVGLVFDEVGILIKKKIEK